MSLGFFGVLHTWNQELNYHPHVHYAVPTCGFGKDGKPVVPKPTGYFLPVKVLSKLYRGKIISGLKKLYSANKLFFPENLSHLKNPQEFEHLMSKATRTNWVVYAKRSFADPTRVIKYLGSYIHRIAISNSRLLSATDKTVSFRARHRTQKHKKIVATLTHTEFCRRYLMHILPKGFRRIRYIGFLTNSNRTASLGKLRQVLPPLTLPTPKTTPTTCPNCKKPTLALLPLLKPHTFLQLQIPAFPCTHSTAYNST